MGRQPAIKSSWPLNTMKGWVRVILQIEERRSWVGDDQKIQTCPESVPPNPHSLPCSQVGRVLCVPLAWGWCSPPPKFPRLDQPPPHPPAAASTQQASTQEAAILYLTLFSLCPHLAIIEAVFSIYCHIYDPESPNFLQ